MGGENRREGPMGEKWQSNDGGMPLVQVNKERGSLGKKYQRVLKTKYATSVIARYRR